MTLQCWEMREPGQPLVLGQRTVDELAADQVLVKVAGCGVCHTDIGFLYEGVRTRQGLPLTLGHEISGVVEAAGSDAGELLGRSVIVPAVIPCGQCELCKAGRGSICTKQIFFGSDLHGGFASHVVTPARGLCVVPDDALAKSGIALADLGVLADAITTPYQAIVRSGLGEGDFAVVIGVGGVGGFGVQIARALGAHVVAIDIDDERLAKMREVGASATFNSKEMDAKAIKKAVRGYVKENQLKPTCWKIFECSGAGAGQEIAFNLLVHGAYLSVVGFTMASIKVRLANLMAFDATAQGNWGCLPEYYPAALDLVMSGEIKLEQFIERRPMSRINETLTDVRDHKIARRPILVPDFD